MTNEMDTSREAGQKVLDDLRRATETWRGAGISASLACKIALSYFAGLTRAGFQDDEAEVEIFIADATRIENPYVQPTRTE